MNDRRYIFHNSRNQIEEILNDILRPEKNREPDDLSIECELPDKEKRKKFYAYSKMPDEVFQSPSWFDDARLIRNHIEEDF